MDAPKRLAAQIWHKILTDASTLPQDASRRHGKMPTIHPQNYTICFLWSLPLMTGVNPGKTAIMGRLT